MSETKLEPATATTNASSWDAAFARLKQRFPRAKDSIVFCIHALQSNPDIAIDDLAAQAAMHGIRVTSASVTAAHRHMSPTPAASARTTPEVAPNAPTASPRPARRVRATDPTVDAETLIKNVIGELQTQGNAETKRLREAMRKAIAVLQAAVG